MPLNLQVFEIFKQTASIRSRTTATTFRREIAMMFQEPMTSLNPVLSIGVQLREGMRRQLGLSRAAAEARAVEALLRLVGIGDQGLR
jgi:ABC-type microcin C transport system duplicated ATPase subunit YejF